MPRLRRAVSLAGPARCLVLAGPPGPPASGRGRQSTELGWGAHAAGRALVTAPPRSGSAVVSPPPTELCTSVLAFIISGAPPFETSFLMGDVEQGSRLFLIVSGSSGFLLCLVWLCLSDLASPVPHNPCVRVTSSLDPPHELQMSCTHMS